MNRHRIIGAVVWCSVLILLVVLFRSLNRSAATTFTHQLSDYVTSRQSHQTFQSAQPIRCRMGDPIFMRTPTGEYLQIGEVDRLQVGSDDGEPVNVRSAHYVQQGRFAFYSCAPPFSGQEQLVYYRTPDSIEWIVETMLPPDKRKQVQIEIERTVYQHRQQWLEQLTPIVRQGLLDAMPVIEDDLRKAIQTRQDRIGGIVSRYQNDWFEEEIVPLVETEIWPVVEKRSRPLANSVGSEIWDRASLWRFGWRYLYDVTPLPQRDLATKEWDRFVETDVGPILKSHVDEFVVVQQQVLRDLAQNKKIQSVLKESLRTFAQDQELQDLVIEITEEVIIYNPKLNRILRQRWNAPETQAILQTAAKQIEPTVNRIGDLIFGTREAGITPEFATVLRNQILGKDKQWWVLETAAVGPAAKEIEKRPNEPLSVEIRTPTGIPPQMELISASLP